MKNLIIIFLMLTTLSADMAFERDKQMHFGVSAFIAFWAETVVHYSTDWSAHAKIAAGAAASLAVGIGKEFYDQYDYGLFDKYDLAWDAIGALAGSASGYFLNGVILAPKKDGAIIMWSKEF